MKIAVCGTGYVGPSNAVLMAQHNEVVALDIAARRVELMSQRQSPIDDPEITTYLANRPLKLRSPLDAHDAYSNTDFLIIAKRTDYDPETNNFNTIEINPKAVMVIKSTVPGGLRPVLTTSGRYRCRAS